MSAAADPFAPLHLDPYHDRHRDQVIGLIRGVYDEYGQVIELDTLDADLLTIPERYAAPTAGFWVLRADGGAVLGTVALRLHGERAELKRLFLAPALRGRSLGRRLSEWTAAEARRRGARVIDIWTDVSFTTAHILYRRLGAHDTGRTRWLGGRNEVVERHFEWLLGGRTPDAPAHR